MPSLIVLCPGALLGPAGGPPPRWPAALARATAIGRHDDESPVPDELPHEAWLRRRLGLDAQSSLEGASAYLDGVAGVDGRGLLRVTPVNLHVGLDSLVLTDPVELAVGADEADALAQAVAPQLREAGYELLAAAPARWYLCTTHPRGTTRLRSARMAVGRRIDAYTPQGDDARRWRRLVNEVQMSWFEHPVNQRREADGRPTVNSLWIDGWVPPAADARLATVLADDPALRGLATAGGARWLPLAEAADARHAAPAGGGDTLVLCDVWRHHERDPAAFSWDDAWQRFAGLLAGLGADRGPPRGFGTLNVVLAGDRRWVELATRRSDRWRPWRRVDARALMETRP